MATHKKVAIPTTDPRAANVFVKVLRRALEEKARPRSRREADRIIAACRAKAMPADLEYPFRLLHLLEDAARAALERTVSAYDKVEQDFAGMRQPPREGTLDLTDASVVEGLITPNEVEAEVAYHVFKHLCNAMEELDKEAVAHFCSMCGLTGRA